MRSHRNIRRAPEPPDQLALLRWHLERYDRLRASTSGRAGVVLSAGALLSAAETLIIGQVLGDRLTQAPLAARIVCAVTALLGLTLVVAAVWRATGVLVTRGSSRSMFDPEGRLPSSPIFNGTDTVRDLRTFDEFTGVIAGQTWDSLLVAAEVELWFCIRQHRNRYANLRGSVRLLRWAALAVPLALVVLVVTSLATV